MSDDITASTTKAGQPSDGPVIVVHGGAYKVPDDILPQAREGARSCALVGWKILKSGGTAVDAVEAAVKSLEDWPTFNAGTGACLTQDETIEMDAFIMEGNSLKVGAVTGVDFHKNPVSLARAVMEQTNHCLFSREGALKLATKLGMEVIDWKSLITEHSIRRLQQYQGFAGTVTDSFSTRANQANALQEVGQVKDHDTVGAVALDRHGNFAAATSTGGITGKLVGRIGDSPLSGSGGFADNDLGAVSTTGHGEAILRVCLAHRCAQQLNTKGSKLAAQEAISFMEKRIQGAAGLICVDRTGTPIVHYNTERMTWAFVNNNQCHFGVLPEDDFVLDVSND